MQVLIVCTANQCRSPMAEFLLREQVDRLGLDWSISSAGTHAIGGDPMHRNTTRLLRERRIAVPATWQTRAVDRNLLAESDLILTATRDQRAMIVEHLPVAVGKTFTILQFARYAGNTRESGLWTPHHRRSPDLLDVLNRSEPAQTPDDDDLADPVGRWYRPFRTCASRLDAAIHRILGDSETCPQPLRPVHRRDARPGSTDLHRRERH